MATAAGRLCHEEVSPSRSCSISSTDRQPMFSFYGSAQVEAVWQFGSQLGLLSEAQRQWHLAAAAAVDILRFVIATNFFIRTSEIEKPFHWINNFSRGAGEEERGTLWRKEKSALLSHHSLPTLAACNIERGRHNDNCQQIIPIVIQLQHQLRQHRKLSKDEQRQRLVNGAFCPSDYGSMCIKLAKINYETGLSNCRQVNPMSLTWASASIGTRF